MNGAIIPYETPRDWIRYDREAIAIDLLEAKALIMALTALPYQRDWFEGLQEVQLRREVAGTSRIEGAEFTEPEFEAALVARPEHIDQLNHSQRQARSAVMSYRWIAALDPDRPVTGELICEIHRRIVTGCDDDHCEPGGLRRADYNVTFGVPRHRGCPGGKECSKAFSDLAYAIEHEYRDHDPIIRAFAAHYHLAAMHPFMDGNGRTARAVEALLLQRADLTDRAFIAMSNYYYENKSRYLAALGAVRAGGHDLTPFLKLGLAGLRQQCEALYAEIKKHTQRALFRNVMYEMFNRLESSRKRVIRDRQIEILKMLLTVDRMDWKELRRRAVPLYRGIKHVNRMLDRDMTGLNALGAIGVTRVAENQWDIYARLQWPQEITQSDFLAKIRQLPAGKTYGFLS